MQKRIGLFAVAVTLLGVFISAPGALALEESAWLTQTPPMLDPLPDLPLGKTIPYSINGNIDCEPRKVIVRPKRLPFQDEVSHESCIVAAAYGEVSTSGFLHLPATNTWASTVNHYGGTLSLLVTPRTSTAFYLSGGNYTGSHLYYIKDYRDTLQMHIYPDGQVTYKVDPSTQPGVIKDKSGQVIPFDYSSISISNNGKYMIADSPVIGSTRIDLETMEVLPFEQPVNYFAGITPAFKTTVTSDGRYAVLASNEFGIFKLYDLSTCSAVPDRITGPVNCKYRDLLPYLKSKIPGIRGYTNIRFLTDYTLSFYSSSIDGSGTHLRQNLLTAHGKQPAKFEYLALGDSYASGEGAYSYKALTDTKDNKCHVSLLSYPYLLAKELDLNTSESVACSGAKIKDITTIYDETTYNSKYSQAKNKSDDVFSKMIFENFLPGYRMQHKFIGDRRPLTVTISTVGNDIGFSDIIKRCIGADTCYDSYKERAQLMQEINGQFDRLVSMYLDLKKANDPRAKLYVFGYPKIVAPSGNCAVNVHLNNDEALFANQLVSYLNDMIENATLKAGVRYVDVESAFEGYRLCENNTWNVAMNGLTFGNDSFIPEVGPFANESYHPNAYGQTLYKNRILESTANFTQGMPEANLAMKAPEINALQPLLAGLISDSTTLPYSHHTDDMIITNTDVGETTSIQLEGKPYALVPSSQYDIYVHSEPRFLAKTTTDSNGNIDARATLPADLEEGYHSIHILGKNLAGDSIDIHQTVYVYNPLNKPDLCGNQDRDKDGTKDGCDGLIDLPQAASISLPSPVEQPGRGSSKDKKDESSPWETYNDPDPEMPMTSSPTITETTTPDPQTTTLAVGNANQEVSAVLGVNSPVSKPAQPFSSTVARARSSQQNPNLRVIQLLGLTVGVLTLLGFIYLARPSRY